MVTNVYCGLCQVEAKNWDTHIENKEHQTNLHDIKKVTEIAKGGMPYILRGVLAQSKPECIS